jgi:glycosyltransferase involved in cell wall biosynthesis
LVSFFLVEYVVELANGLADEHSVHVIFVRDRVQQTFGDEIHEVLHPNIEITQLPYRSLRHSSVLEVVRSMFRVLNSFRPDVIHIQESSHLLTGLFLHFSSKPVIATVHDVELHPGRQSRQSRSLKYALLARLARTHAYTKVIVHGENLKKMYAERYRKAPRDIFVVPHGCLNSFLPAPDSGSEIPEEVHTVLFFGRIQEYKGLKYLIAAEPLVSAVLPDFKILVAGQGDELQTYKPLLDSNPHFEVNDRFIPKAEVPYFFQRASLVILPYIEASQSGIASIAFAFGKPVIATDVGSLPEMVQHNLTGLLIPPNDEMAIAQAIVALLTDHPKRELLSRNAKEASLTKFSWKSVAALTSEVYREALEIKDFSRKSPQHTSAQ